MTPQALRGNGPRSARRGELQTEGHRGNSRRGRSAAFGEKAKRRLRQRERACLMTALYVQPVRSLISHLHLG